MPANCNTRSINLTRNGYRSARMQPQCLLDYGVQIRKLCCSSNGNFVEALKAATDFPLELLQRRRILDEEPRFGRASRSRGVTACKDQEGRVGIDLFPAHALLPTIVFQDVVHKVGPVSLLLETLLDAGVGPHGVFACFFLD
jgi:hypothetical protein